MRILVTGAAGFLGRTVAAVLLEAGHQVTAGTRRPDRLPAQNLRTVRLDVTDKANVLHAIVDSDCDAVVHLAGLTRMRESASQPLAFYDVNTAGTLNVMHAIDELAQRKTEPPHIVFASTGAVYGSQPAVPEREDDPTQPENPYAASKLAAEDAIRHHARAGRSAATILRLSNIAGGVGSIYDDDGDHIVPRVLRAIQHGTPVVVNGDGETTRDYIHVVDAAEAIRLVLAARPQGSIVLNIGSGIETSVRSIIAVAERITGTRAQVKHRPAGPEARRVVMSIDRATARLGWKPTRSSADQFVPDAWNAAHRSAQAER